MIQIHDLGLNDFYGQIYIFFLYLKHHFLNLFKSSLFYESLKFSFPIRVFSPYYK